VCATEALNLNALPAALQEVMDRAQQQRAAAGSPAELTAASSRELGRGGRA
jgi:hypothetical protein